MKAEDYLAQLNSHLSHLYRFARQVNELDFAMSLAGESRGAQDVGWATTITAGEVSNEIAVWLERKQPLSKAELRIVLLLYCQLAEAGGVYEGLKNTMRVFRLEPYVLWPFKDLVRVKKSSSRVIGPNANATFRDLATYAKEIGFIRLSELLELAFRDDVRNSVSHADYVIWNDGLRLPMRNGGYGAKISFQELSDALLRGVNFFELLRQYNDACVRSFHPPKEIVGRFSGNPPMPWTVAFDPERGTFGLSSSSPGAVVTPEYERQSEINHLLGGKVLALYAESESSASMVEAHVMTAGFEPNVMIMDSTHMAELISDCEKFAIWDERSERVESSDVLLLSPWGFRWLRSTADFDAILQPPLIDPSRPQ